MGANIFNKGEQMFYKERRRVESKLGNSGSCNLTSGEGDLMYIIGFIASS